ncbi:large proline-rich protein BAG6 isoform X1 [Colletes gigas]|uniref:large proline-rich protein BAG6 isoform X1 n=1 Tax=Colletes gigas TaxID=935657 RepID=UPI001C9B79F7|nr:large proline-rich protein BAG6 isoform X1 [Colletes gigas]XP_043258009.1 large proline-rich protein BAG6 isoform X1 [Colletes gigas]
MIDLTVKTLDSQNHAFSLEDDQITVRGFKEHIAESVSVPADSQRLIYCGRVLQDEKKLNDYDVNGKVIHLVQRAPPQPGQRGNDGGQIDGQGQGHGQPGQNSQRTQYRLTRAQMHGNAMYLGAMSVPAEIVEGHGLPVPELSNSLSNSRLNLARRMLNRENELIERLDDPGCPLNPPSSESNQPLSAQQVQVQLEAEQFNNEGRTIVGTRITEDAAAAFAAGWSATGNNVTLIRAGNFDDSGETVPLNDANDANDDNQPDAQQPQQSQSEQQGSTSNNTDRQSTSQLPRPPQMAELLELLLNTQDRLRPYIERYRDLMLADRPLNRGSEPESVEESQRIVDGVSESLHYLSHACHALSDIIVDMSQQPPRNLRCRPIIIQHSAILQPGIPIQVEAHISLHGRNANNNNGGEENNDSATTPAQGETNETATEEANQQREPEAATQQTEQQQRDQTQSPFGTVFNLPNNLEVLMEVSPENNMDAPSGSEQPQTGENNNNNNNNRGRVGGNIGSFPWGSAPPPDFIRNLMQAVAGYMVQGGITSTTIRTENPPTAGGQQTVGATFDGNTNAGQSTQARSNVGTHPTTATQTRSTSRPHVFHQQAHPLGVGMSIGQGFDLDPFLPCNSHHVRRASTTTSSTVTSTSQGTRTSQTSTAETQTQPQTATTSTTTSNTSSTNTTPVTTAREYPPFINYIRRAIEARNGRPPANMARRVLVDAGRVAFGNGPVGIYSRSYTANVNRNDFSPSVAECLLPFMAFFTAQNAQNEDNLFVNLGLSVFEHMSVQDMMELRDGNWEPLSYQRRYILEFFQNAYPNATTETLQEQVTERIVSELIPDLQELLEEEEEEYANNRNESRIDICATVEALLRRCINDFLRLLFNNDVSDDRFGQEAYIILHNLGRQLWAVLRYSIRNGQTGLETIISRFWTLISEERNPVLRVWLQEALPHYRVSLPPDSEILPLLIYKDAAPSQSSTVPSAPAHQPSQTQPEVEPMETETVEERTTSEASLSDDSREEVPETFPDHEALPSDWVPVIARDGVRQRRQLQMQGMTNGGVATFSDAYLGTLPTKRRKLIEKQKPRLLVSPTPNNSAIAASMERLVREGVTRSGVEEVDGAAVAVAVDPGVRRAFGQAIRDCLNPRRYGTPDFPDPLRFPNATKYFADQDRPPK